MAAGPILIVEDNQVNALILRSMLRKHGYEPVVAADGVEGIALSEQHHPRLILMDLQMPRLDGFAAAAEISRSAGEASPVIVAVTANAGDDVRAACREAGFAGVLAKPVLIEELIATVRRFLPDA
jgi:two-component system, sensor histidine kinase and response regulator